MIPSFAYQCVVEISFQNYNYFLTYCRDDAFDRLDYWKNAFPHFIKISIFKIPINEFSGPLFDIDNQELIYEVLNHEAES